ncbi:MAG TPA: thiamine pyrophosphate-binding protein [Chloroflexota bacterium]|nr:thiamine pyrophosphate-binding protein [Chloroflexota bacterium]
MAAQSVPADLLLEQIRKCSITHVLTVPDTVQKSLLAALAHQETPRLLTVCTEDEAVGINLGLYAGNQNPMLIIQNNGFYACLNAVKSLSLDARVPLLMLIGEFARDVSKASSENALRAVHLLVPTLETWGIPYFRLEGPDDAGCLCEAYERAHGDRGPAAVIVGAPTC